MAGVSMPGISFSIKDAVRILSATPDVLEALLGNLNETWTNANEGPDTWSAFDVVGHLIHGEKTDWISRTKIILEFGTGKTFPKFDRFAQFEESRGKTMCDLLDEFREARRENLEFLTELNPGNEILDKKGVHPAFGEVTLRQLLATWTIHDFVHLAQINRVLAKQYKSEIGPWVEYISLMKDEK